MGAMYAADLFGMALFQLMQVSARALSTVQATQVVVMLTSISTCQASASRSPARRWWDRRSAQATVTGRGNSATR